MRGSHRWWRRVVRKSFQRSRSKASVPPVRFLVSRTPTTSAVTATSTQEAFVALRVDFRQVSGLNSMPEMVTAHHNALKLSRMSARESSRFNAEFTASE